MLGSVGDEDGTEGDGTGAIPKFIDDAKNGADDEVNDLKDERIIKRHEAKYPADCYSFLAIHGPFEKPLLFSFGLMVWAFQVRQLNPLFPMSSRWNE